MKSESENDIANRVAFHFLVGGKRPDDLFAGVFYDIREKAKQLKKDWSAQAQQDLQNTLQKDLNSKGIPVGSLKVSLGQYRGSKFVTSAKLVVKLKDEKSANNLLTYLKGKYSPKYKLKKFENGVAEYNVR